MKENGEIVMKQTDKSGKSGAGIWIILIFVCLILLVLSVFWLQNSRVYKLNLPKQGNKFYIEQPYNGIYEITKEEYWLLRSQLAPIESFVSEEKEQAGIRIDGRDYYMYAVVSKSQTGKQIGIVDGDSDHQIYELKGYDPEKWIVEFMHSGLMDNYVLMKEEDVTETIEGIEQEFE